MSPAFAAVVLLAGPWGDAGAAPLPLVAQVRAAHVEVFPGADGGAPVGDLEQGALVVVVGCAPACDAAGARAVLEGGGLVSREALALPAAEGARAPGALRWGTLRAAAAVFDAPGSGRPVARLPAGRTLAFDDAPADGGAGWLPLHGGGFVAAAAVRAATPSGFAGLEGPDAGVVAFTVRGADGGLPRHAAFPVLRWDEAGVTQPDGGVVPRAATRLALARRRPGGVPVGARWVNVELTEQVLTAYEGDALVFATLVSAGTGARPTSRGLHAVYRKALHERMRGPDYWVEEVPHVLFFHRGEALHGAFWHDGFGRPRSHGCVNLSPADARWLFDWAPPPLPPGWHAVGGPSPGLSLWVNVEARPPPPRGAAGLPVP